MVFIETGDQKGAEHRQNRRAPPQCPVFDGHPVKRLSPAIEKSETDASVSDEVAGLANEVMYLVPMSWADRPKEMHPQWIKPSAGVIRRHRGGGLESDHQNAQRRRDPIQDPMQDRLQPGNSERTHGWIIKVGCAQG